MLCQNSEMTIYEGGSRDEDNKYMSINDNSDLSSPIELSHNQIFIEFTSDGGSKKNFSTYISYGIE